jgi:hypothetical protein
VEISGSAQIMTIKPIENLPPPWVKFPDPVAWDDWSGWMEFEFDAPRWYYHEWLPAWKASSISEKIAYIERWQAPGQCFFMQLEWIMYAVMCANPNYPRFLCKVINPVRHLCGWLLHPFVKPKDVPKSIPPGMVWPVDVYALPPPWSQVHCFECSDLMMVLRNNHGDRWSGPWFLDIWIPFWQTLDARQRQEYLVRWPCDVEWKNFLAYAAAEGMLAPQQPWPPIKDSAWSLWYCLAFMGEFKTKSEIPASTLDNLKIPMTGW